MKKTLLSALAVALLLGQPLLSSAQEAGPGAQKPVAVVVFSGLDELIKDADMIGKLADNPMLGQMLEAQAGMFTQGLDGKRPLGAVISSDGFNFQVYGFVPVTDLQQLIAGLPPQVPTEDAGDGVYSIEAGPQKLYIKQVGNWAFVVQSPDAFADLPKDPLKSLKGLDKKYDLAIQANVQNIPEMWRTLAVDQMRVAMEASLERTPDESEEEYELRKRMMQNQIESMQMLVNETDQFTLGFAIDGKAKAAYFEVGLTAVAGSKMAAQFATLKDTTSQYAGFLSPDAAVTMNLSASTGQPGSQELEQAVATLDSLKAKALKEIDNEAELPDEESKQVVKDIVGQVIDGVTATVKSGKVDGALAVSLQDQKPTLIAGAYVADSAPFETALKKFDKLARTQDTGDGGYPGIDFDADKYKDVRFHTMSVPIPPGDDAAKVFGDKLNVAIGMAPKSIYLAAGDGSMDRLKKAIDESATSTSKRVPPMQLTVSLGSIMQFAASQDPNPITAIMAQELAKSEGKDHLILTVKPATDGVIYRLEAQEGVLKLIGQAGAMATGGAQFEGPGALPE